MSSPLNEVLVGDCRERLAELADGSIDAVVTDPPYELGFMGKKWDASGIAYDAALWGEVLRVLKPGGHLLAFGGTRTYHRMACAIEDAGFEIRDSIHWLQGNGFPKSLNVSKAIDKAAGAQREVVGPAYDVPNARAVNPHFIHAEGVRSNAPKSISYAPTAPATDDAKRWQGWGTALKPAHEPIVVARKPFKGTVAANVLEHGTGALNIDATRIAGSRGSGNWSGKTASRSYGWGWDSMAKPNTEPHDAGRWPANVILDEHSAPILDAQAGDNVSRFFYVAKPSRAERNAGTDNNTHPTVKPIKLMRYLIRLVTPPSGVVLDPFLGSGTTACAAILEGFDWIGCEFTEEYLPIIEARIAHAKTQAATKTLTIFDETEAASHKG